MGVLKRAVCSRTAMFAALVFLLTGSARAQAPVYRPSEVIRISATFDGPDAGKVSCANMTVQLTSVQDSKNQPNFLNGFGFNCKPAGPRTFELSFTVTDNMSSGEYDLVQVMATVEVGHDSRVNFQYTQTEFPALKFKIENPTTIKKPTIKNITVLPKP